MNKEQYDNINDLLSNLLISRGVKDVNALLNVSKEDCHHYRLYQNLKTIKRLKKVIIFEGEKSVMMCESFYPDSNFALAICGSNLSDYQRDLIVQDLGVEEVIIAIDKQYKTELSTEDDRNEYERYIKKVQKIADKFVNFINVYIVYCDDDRLGYKDSPSDKGKEILEQLMKEKERYLNEI